MKQSSFSKKRIIHIYIIVFIIIMIVLIATALMFKYYVEGEKNLPFNLKKISTISTAESSIIQNEDGTWNAKLLQKNDIFFTVEKNSNYKKEDIIKKITFNNFKINKTNDNLNIIIYKPNTNNFNYTYSDEYKVEDFLEYTGGLETNAEILQINNQGGVVGFSIITNNIGEYIFNENEKLPSDGRLLSKAGVDLEEIKFQISFDLTIETESEHEFRSSVTLDLPVGNILQDGIGTKEETNLDKIVFKRL